MTLHATYAFLFLLTVIGILLQVTNYLIGTGLFANAKPAENIFK